MLASAVNVQYKPAEEQLEVSTTEQSHDKRKFAAWLLYIPHNH